MESDIASHAADAALALQHAADARTALAKRARAPVWYHPALGLLAGGMVAALAAPPAVMLASVAVFYAGVALLVVAYRRHTGMWIPGYRAGRTRVLAIGLGVATVLLAGGSVFLADARGLHWAAAVGGLVIFGLVTAAGFVWEALYAADLVAEVAPGRRA